MADPQAAAEIVRAESLIEGTDPFVLFEDWLAEADRTEPADANAMTLATVDENGLPDARIVLLKGLRDGQFVFYTNTLSAKGRQMAGQGKAALCFHWKSLARQVRLRGPVALVSDAEADEYFATRPRGSQIGAWASRQSETLEARPLLKDAVMATEQKFDGADVPRPPHWSGYALTPVYMEFWQDQPFRLHDRLVFDRALEAGAQAASPSTEWAIRRVFP